MEQPRPSRRRPSKRQRDNQKARAAGVAPEERSKRRRPSKRQRDNQKFARRHGEEEGRGAAAREEEGREQEALICSFCGKNFTTLVGGSPFEMKKYVAFERQAELLCENGGAWWMTAMGGEMWRRCHWWKSEHVDGDVNGWMCVLRRCTLCRKESHELRKCARRLRDLRTAAEDSSSEEESVF